MKEVLEEPGLFIESAVVDQFNHLVFASLWGHTAAILGSLAKITAGDLNTLTIDDSKLMVTKEMVKKAGKLPVNHYGDITHVLLYKTMTVSEQVGHRQLIAKDKERLSDDRIFFVVKAMSVFPLMDHWKIQLLKTLREQNMLVDLKTIYGEVYGVHINLGNEDDFRKMLSSKVKSGELEVDHVMG